VTFPCIHLHTPSPVSHTSDASHGGQGGVRTCYNEILSLHLVSEQGMAGTLTLQAALLTPNPCLMDTVPHARVSLCQPEVLLDNLDPPSLLAITLGITSRGQLSSSECHNQLIASRTTAKGIQATLRVKKRLCHQQAGREVSLYITRTPSPK
jgi:hypothetical protein